ncbi:MAG TPA: phosphatase PAP2 family protein [Elusimicrobiales bacterium]|nr:phosphatase PAP2 family protein [Elusimicrobiales bacterium]
MEHKNLLRRLGLSSLLFAFSCAVHAQAGDAHAWKYLNADALSVSQIAPVPADGSAADLLDMETLLEWQKNRTEQQCEDAKKETNAAFSEVFGALSPFPEPLPEKVAAILKKIKSDTDYAVDVIKKHYARQRPFARNPELRPCLDPAKGNIGPLAYPSGHAAISRVFALTLSDLVPAKKDLFLGKADEAALNRVISGLHHPSDIEAGKRLADSLYARFLKTPAFKKDLKKLRKALAREAAAAK